MLKKLFGFGTSKEMPREVTVLSPLSGKVLKLEEVPDPVFSQKMMGDGLAIEPSGGKLVSPVSGTIIQVFPTKHAIGIETDSGLEILIHIGLETVNLNGEGFDSFVKQGDRVQAGQKLIEFSLHLIREKAKSAITPIIITNGDKLERLDLEFPHSAVAGETPIMHVDLKG